MISLDYGGWNIQIDNRYSFSEYFSDFCSTLTEQHIVLTPSLVGNRTVKHLDSLLGVLINVRV